MFSLSMSDLVLLEEFIDAFAREDKYAINRVLWKNGMDVNYPVEIQYVQHRNLQNKVVTCERYIGTERSDKEWLGLGAASLDAHINSSKDESLRDELKALDPRAAKSYDEDRECGVDLTQFDDDCV